MANKEQNPNKPKNAGGRPTKYKAEYCQDIIKYFDIEPTVPIYDETLDEDGKVINRKETGRRPADLPFLSKYARKIGVVHDTLLEWCKVHPRFSAAYNVAKAIQKEILISNGVSGLYNASAFIFTAKNIAGMRDKHDLEHSGNIKVIIDN